MDILQVERDLLPILVAQLLDSLQFADGVKDVFVARVNRQLVADGTPGTS
jgi:hypothetical protein